ncbi:TetR/AcrR family transcriptional regulator [Paeniglutamicibacter sp. ORCA_105]|uniref:TetR/AcrR family transcriptional regulator n=1 Tax=Paeniglutamicibacter sp. ORCA_105 TaxID=3377336 RepID=UPI00389306A9
MKTDTETATEQGVGESRPVGRPRDSAIAERVLRAAVDLLGEKPLGEDFTLAELVERSGASRAAIYRRWENRQAVVVAALDADRRSIEHAERDTVLETMVASYEQVLLEIDTSVEGNRLINQRLALGLRDKALQQAYWERHVRRRRAASLALLERGKETGEIRADANLEVALDLINGAAYYQTVVRPDGGNLESRERVGQAIRMLFLGIAAT